LFGSLPRRLKQDTAQRSDRHTCIYKPSVAAGWVVYTELVVSSSMACFALEQWSFQPACLGFWMSLQVACCSCGHVNLSVLASCDRHCTLSVLTSSSDFQQPVLACDNPHFNLPMVI